MVDVVFTMETSIPVSLFHGEAISQQFATTRRLRPYDRFAKGAHLPRGELD